MPVPVVVVLAHGAAGRTDPPLSLWVCAYLAAMVVLVTWAVVRARVGMPTQTRTTTTRHPLRRPVRVLGALATGAVIVSAWHGDAGRTSTPHAAVLIGVWIGLPVLALVLGDVWRDDDEPATDWPAAGAALAFVWLALVRHPDRPEPIGIAVIAYALVAPFTGRPLRRWWSRCAASVRPHLPIDTRPGTRALLAVPVGAVLLDIGDRDSTIALVACVAIAAVAMRVVADDRALVPVAVAWFVATYLSLLLVQGQVLLAVASDPLGRGVDLFGTADRSVDFDIVDDDVFLGLQWLVLAAGHALGTLQERTTRTAVTLAAASAVAVTLLLGR